MIESLPDLIADLRAHRAHLAAVQGTLAARSSDLAEVIDAIDDAITFLIERQQPPRADA